MKTSKWKTVDSKSYLKEAKPSKKLPKGPITVEGMPIKLKMKKQQSIKGFGIVTKKDGELVQNILNKKFPVPKNEDVLTCFVITQFESEAIAMVKNAEKVMGKKLWKIVPVKITVIL